MKILAIGDFHGKFPIRLRKKIKKEDPDLVISIGDYAGIKEWYPYLMECFKLLKKGKPYRDAEEYFGEKKLKKLLKKDYKAGKEVLSELNKLNKKVIYIFGNTDDDWYEYPFTDKIVKVKKRNKNFLKNLKNLKQINYSKTKLKKIDFIGFGGYMDIDEFLKERAKTKEDKERIKRIIQRRRKSKKKLFDTLKNTKAPRILVLHYTPKGYFDKIINKKNPYDGKKAGVDFFTQAIKKYQPSLVLCGHMHEYQGKKKIGKSIIINSGPACEGKASIIEFDEKTGKVGEIRFIK